MEILNFLAIVCGFYFLGILEEVVAYFENLQRYNDIFYGSSNCAF